MCSNENPSKRIILFILQSIGKFYLKKKRTGKERNEFTEPKS